MNERDGWSTEKGGGLGKKSCNRATSGKASGGMCTELIVVSTTPRKDEAALDIAHTL